MKLKTWHMVALLAFCIARIGYAAENIVNVFTWAGEIPYSVIEQFEKETSIKVNYSTFDTNEAMYAKLRASKNADYDIIEPSSYYIDRMRKQNKLEKLDKTKLSNFKNIDPFFMHQTYDPNSNYSIPFIWGVTGIFINKNYFSEDTVRSWADLADARFKNQLMMLDDAREVFSMGLRLSAHSINDNNPEHIRSSFMKLKSLMPNIRLFNNDAVNSILIDEDAVIGMAWNGDLFKAHAENPQLQFIFPEDGFEIWVDNFAILKNASHKENSYVFLNYLMRPDVAKKVSLNIHYSTANLAARNLMSPEIRDNPTLYPPLAIMRRGEFQTDMNPQTLALYEKYWEQLKISS